MKLEVEEKRLRAFPVQLVETAAGVVVRRGCVQVKFSGAEAFEVVHHVFEKTSRDAGATEDELLAAFAAPERENLRELLAALVARRLLVAADDPSPPVLPEGPLEVFYWHFGDSPQRVASRMESTKISILGVNSIARQLAQTLRASGIASYEVVDHPLLRNVRYVDPAGAIVAEAWGREAPRPIPFEQWSDGAADIGCLVATADFGGMQAMRQWNEFACEVGCHFLPVILQDLIGYVGPLVIPGETACYECLRARQNSNFDDPEGMRIAEDAAFDGQTVAGFHPAMASVLGDLAAIELTKFYGRGLPNPRVSTLLEMNLLTSELVTRRVLKIPRCRVCSPLLARGSESPEKTVFLPGNAVHE